MQLVDYGTNLKQNVLEFVPLDSFFFCLFVQLHSCTCSLQLWQYCIKREGNFES